MLHQVANTPGAADNTLFDGATQVVKLDLGTEGNSQLLDPAQGLPVKINDSETLNAILKVLQYIAAPLSQDSVTGRTRVAVEGISGNLTLTTVGNISQLGGVAANSSIYDIMHDAWSNTVRRAIT